jgi:hypothetical protein
MIAQITKKATKKIDWYARYIMEHLVLSTDDRGLYCEVASERIEGLIYRVDMDEAMTAIRCQCYSKKPCKHIAMANAAFAHKASEITCEVEAGRWYICDHSQQVWLQDGKWLCSCGNSETCVHREAVLRHLENEEPVIETSAQEVVESAPVAIQQYQMSQGVRERLAAIAKPAEVVAEPRKYYWCPNRCCYKWSDSNKVCEPQPDGKVWDSDICDWVMPPSGEPIDHQAELAAAGWYAPGRQVKNTAKALLRAEINEIKGRKRVEHSMMNAALTTNQGFQLMR